MFCPILASEKLPGVHVLLVWKHQLSLKYVWGKKNKTSHFRNHRAYWPSECLSVFPGLTQKHERWQREAPGGSVDPTECSERLHQSPLSVWTSHRRATSRQRWVDRGVSQHNTSTVSERVLSCVRSVHVPEYACTGTACVEDVFVLLCMSWRIFKHRRNSEVGVFVSFILWPHHSSERQRHSSKLWSSGSSRTASSCHCLVSHYFFLLFTVIMLQTLTLILKHLKPQLLVLKMMMMYQWKTKQMVELHFSHLLPEALMWHPLISSSSISEASTVCVCVQCLFRVILWPCTYRHEFSYQLLASLSKTENQYQLCGLSSDRSIKMFFQCVCCRSSQVRMCVITGMYV